MDDQQNEKQQVLDAHAQPAAASEAMESAAGRGIALTERAAQEVKRVIQEEGLSADTCLRVGAKGGGCSGFSYVLDFDKQGRTEFDISYDNFGVTLLIDKKSEFVMAGTVVDFEGGLLNRGFVFTNPASTGTCGCGTSFSV
ncbi:MAG: iron-sulfur cluster assembly accessory protein [Planctomycetota bacterium]|jgi:iron-sulfur cluster assembly protein|nr:iron-sulfur cluster assembly accessory protein [Planctomycetota bacterium]